MLPDPLDRSFDTQHKSPHRILSDRGIRQALDLGLMTITPELEDHSSPIIQPATLDMSISGVEHIRELVGGSGHWVGEGLTLHAQTVSSVCLAEFVDVWQGRVSAPLFFYLWAEDRSSIHRLGGYIANQGRVSCPGKTHEIELGNFGQNDIHLQEGERVAQFYIAVYPFADDFASFCEDGVRARTLELGEQVRSLDMGVEVITEEQLRHLHDKAYFTVTPKLVQDGAMVLVHASNTVYRLRKIEGGIDFSKRKQYSEDDLLEPVDISKGYTIKPYEHIVIETKERFALSPHVGIRFWDNVLHSGFSSYDHLRSEMPHSLDFINLTDSWIDPGYEGMFGRQPKWLDGRTIYPGDVIGFGQAYFFPKGVERAYGNPGLKSQYKGKDSIAFSE